MASENTTDLKRLEDRLWAAADELRANSTLTPAEYRDPVLGLIFLAFAEHRFDELRPELEAKATARRPVTRRRLPRPRRALRARDRPAVVARRPARGRGPRREHRPRDGRDRGDEHRPARTSFRAGTRSSRRASSLELVRLFAPLPRTLSGDAFGLIYEYFLAEFAAQRGPARRRVLHAAVDRAADRRGDRAVPRQGLRPRLRLGRHVRPLRQVRRRPQRLADPRPLRLRAGAEGGHRPARPDEPRAARALGRHPPRQQLLRGPPRRRRPLRLRHGQSAVQRQRRRQVEARRRHAPLPLRAAAARQRQLPLDPALLLGAQRDGPRRLRDGELRRRTPARARPRSAAS